MESMTMNRGDIYWVDLEPTKGSEIKKKRPCLILSANPINKARRTVVVIPLSSSKTVAPPITVTISCLKKEAIAVIDQIRTVDKSRILEFIETSNDHDMLKIEHALRQVLVL
jgi:mRNA interferase MazF